MFLLKQKVMEEFKRRRARSIVDKNTLWPSQASVVKNDGEKIGKCLRASFYEKTGVQQTNPIDDAVIAMGYMGKKIEDGLVEILKNQGLWEANNVKWQANGISGEVDIIIRVPSDNGIEEDMYIVECKSCSGYYINKELFGYYQGTGVDRAYVKGKPKDKHLLQSALYANVAKEKGYKGTILFYISRDESKMTEFLISVDDDGNILINNEVDNRFRIQDIFARYEVLQFAIDAKELPDKDYKPEYTDQEVEYLFENKRISKNAKDNHMSRKQFYCDTECNYCEYKLKCTEQTSAEKQAEDKTSKTNKKNNIEEKPDYMAFGSF